MDQQTSTNTQYRFAVLAELIESDGNVASIGRDQVDDLIASIAAHGLQQGLVVKQEGDKLKVSAGKRRHRAIRALHAQGQWPDDRQIPVAVVAAGASEAEISTTENLSRKDMHPVDEFAAFQKMVDEEGCTVADLVARFGRTERYIEQRLKLSRVSPKLLELLRQDKIQLAQVIALSVTDDHAEQLKVWKAAEKSNWESARAPDQLRKVLTEKKLEVGRDEIATFLGAEDYNAGGGAAEPDLFSDAVYLPDSKLARKLANEKLQALAKRDVKPEGWAWMEVRLEFGYTEANRAKLSTYGQSYYSEHAATNKTDWPAKAKEFAGAVVTISRKGEVEVHRALVRADDAKKAAAEGKAKQKGNASRDTSKKPVKKAGQLSFAAIQRLQGERTAVLRKVLSTDRRRALAALAADLVRDQGLGEARMMRSGPDRAVVRIAGDRQFTAPVQIRAGIEAHPYSAALEKAEKDWATKLKPGKSDLFAWLLTQPEDLTLDLLAFLTAKTIVAGETGAHAKDRGTTFAATAGVDMTQHWAPTQTWLESQPTAIAIDAVTEAKGKQAAAELAKLKGKAAVVARAAKLLEGSGWIPKELRLPESKPGKAKRPGGNRKAPAKKAAPEKGRAKK